MHKEWPKLKRFGHSECNGINIGWSKKEFYCMSEGTFSHIVPQLQDKDKLIDQWQKNQEQIQCRCTDRSKALGSTFQISGLNTHILTIIWTRSILLPKAWHYVCVLAYFKFSSYKQTTYICISSFPMLISNTWNECCESHHQ